MVDMLTMLPALLSLTLITFASSILCLRYYPAAPTASLWVLVFSVLLIVQFYFIWFGQPLLLDRYADDDITRFLMWVHSINQFGHLLLIACLLTAAFIGRAGGPTATPARGRGPMMLMQGVLSLLLLQPLGLVVIGFAAWSLAGGRTLDSQDRTLTVAGLVLGILALLLLLGTVLFAFWYVTSMASMGIIR